MLDPYSEDTLPHDVLFDGDSIMRSLLASISVERFL
jgi:hypothetical protein